jgi:hypothetical protein
VPYEDSYQDEGDARTYMQTMPHTSRRQKRFEGTLRTEQHKKTVQTEWRNQGVQRHFIPPRSPHFGELWESGVRLAKYHLKRIVGKATLSYEELLTVLAHVEACLNSRPVIPMSDFIRLNSPDTWTFPHRRSTYRKS